MTDPLENLLGRMGRPPAVPRDSEIRAIVEKDPRFRLSLDPNLPAIDTSSNRVPVREGVYKDQLLTSRVPLTREEATAGRRLAGRTDITWIHLGCLYEMVRVRTDVLAQYQIENKQPNMHVESHRFDQPWLHGLQSWGTLLQGIDPTLEADCVRWLLNQLFVRRTTRTWWRLRRERVTISDPTRAPITNPLDQIQVSVFLPLGSRGSTVLRSCENGYHVFFDPTLQPPGHLTPELDQFT